MNRIDLWRRLNTIVLLALAIGLLVSELGNVSQDLSAEVGVASLGTIVSYENAYLRLRVVLAAALHAAAMWQAGLARSFMGLLASVAICVEYGLWYWWTSRLGVILGLSDKISLPLLPFGGTWLDIPLVVTSLVAVAFASASISKALYSKREQMSQ